MGCVWGMGMDHTGLAVLSGSQRGWGWVEEGAERSGVVGGGVEEQRGAAWRGGLVLLSGPFVL